MSDDADDGPAADLRAARAAADTDRAEHERIRRDLLLHQLELEQQNRELREAQAALEQSRSRYADLYDFAPIAYFTFDARGCVLEVNLTGATLVGRDRAQLIGAPFVALLDLVDPALFWGHLRRCGEARAPVVSELALIARDATMVYLRAVSSPVFDPAGTPTGFRTALIDITDRHRAEAARAEALASEQRLRQELEALDSAKTVLARSLAAGSEQSLPAILQIVVDQAREIADAEYAALGLGGNSGAPFDAWVYAGMAPDQAAAIGRTPRGVGTLGAVVDNTQTIRTPDLATHPAFLGFPPAHPTMSGFLGVPIEFGGRALGNLYLANRRGGGAFSDRDQRAVESLARYVGLAMEIARLGDAAHQAIQSRDDLLAIVSHDLRSPLSTISVSANLLLRILRSGDEPFALRQADTIVRAAARMGRLIDDLLIATTIEAGHLTVSTAPVRLDRIVAEAVDEIAATAGDHPIAIDAAVAPDLPEVVCDRDRVHQVLTNLLGNALRFTPADGRIAIEVTRRDAEVQVSVTDSGPGIPEDALARVFERYWRAGAQRDGSRLGLGLYICHGIVASHGGRIWAERRPGEGARITFTLPVAGARSTLTRPALAR